MLWLERVAEVSPVLNMDEEQAKQAWLAKLDAPSWGPGGRLSEAKPRYPRRPEQLKAGESV